ncbi:osmoprotectant transport system permease protein [Luteibacter rhizovicinus]|uniref:Osmoprotectant transport system permease protein n=1 Tax=Luteibacter rhizovicinus TaxID=242606 RepID=A0A4V2W3Y5_9GAMM|nr:ABC transporter permease [Luteibacter rhizovicinus]TCV93819.1 osmoprotectant transport system permease protein [Luteibacter rhizovicinus]
MTIAGRGAWRIAWPCLALALLLIALPRMGPVFHAWMPELRAPVYTRTSFVALTAAHIGLVGMATLIAVVLGLGIGILATRPATRSLLPTVRAVAVIGQTFPPVAVLAIAVPLLGFGAAPTLLALCLYGVLPVLGQTVAGIENVSRPALDAADGMGYGRWRKLWEVELPLAAGPIMAGVRLSAIVSVGTATIGSAVGASTLGAPIIEGLVSNNTAYVVQGALLVAALAMSIDAVLAWIERYVRRGLV